MIRKVILHKVYAVVVVSALKYNQCLNVLDADFIMVESVSVGTNVSSSENQIPINEKWAAFFIICSPLSPQGSSSTFREIHQYKPEGTGSLRSCCRISPFRFEKVG